MSFKNKIVTAGLVGTLALSCLALPTSLDVASADPASDLAAAAAQLDSLGAQLSSSQEALASATTELEQTDVSISEKQASIESSQAELSEKRGALGDEMRGAYKSGTQSTLDLILGSTSVEDLVSRIYYLDKSSEARATAIAEVQELERQLSQELSELQSTQQAQQQQVADLQAQAADYQSQVAHAQSVYDSLDAEMRAQLAEQEANNANVSAAVNAVENNPGAAAGETAGADDSGAADTDAAAPEAPATPSTPSTPEAPSQPEQPAQPSQPEQPSQPSKPSNPSGGSTAPVGGGLSTALAQVGKPYVYGAAGPNAFDCSGLVCYSYGYARGRTTYAMISSLQASGDWKTDMSQLNVGDLVFPHSGHVGIYVGNGQYVHAANPASGVIVGKLYGFLGGGSYY